MEQLIPSAVLLIETNLIRNTHTVEIHVPGSVFFLYFAKLGNCLENEGVVPLNNKIFDPNMTNHTITYYHFPLSPPSRAALLLVRALGIKHDLKIVNITNGEQNTPEFLKINPFHTVPAIDDNGFYVYDSSIIMKYLSKKYAKDDSLFPNDTKKCTIVEERLYFASNYLFQSFRDYIIPVMFGNEQPSTEKAKAFDQNLRQLNDFLENEKWVAGTNITVADFSIITIVSTAEAIMFDVNKYANVSAWYKRSKEAMASFGYEEINQSGAEQFGNVFKTKLKQFV
ncbi:glutathione S-transferase D1-like [Coccinella septempunctata]|uniref:glutathione S-transferase D1-like n=1 Tax=Coccinella septempunctata TaxID=41139 RepID=UPI001D09033F|nr:glutathione S-transferase D1-like [Coccinella septempunctata]